MKTTLFTKYFMAATISAMIAGCGQEESLNGYESIIPGEELEIVVNDIGFTNEDPASRVSETDYKTTFTDGDEIGIYIISGNTVAQKNLKAEKSADGWSVEGLYNYEGANYIAYFPYDENMTTEDIKSEDDIVTYFDSKFTENQSLEDSYKICDLMTANVEAENGTVTFNLSHKRSMLEFVIPTYMYKTGDGDDAYTYSIPLGLEIKIGDVTYNPRFMGDCVYRCIVKPSTDAAEISFSGSFTDAKQNKPVTFAKENIALAANGCITYNITYQDAPGTEVQTRAIAVGDYYYSDGNIYPWDFPAPPTAGCLGVIFSTTTNSETAKDGETACSHGYVLSLYNATGNTNGNLGAWDYYMWDNTDDNNNKISTIGLTDVAYAGNDGAVDESLISDLKGLKYTDIIMKEMAASGVDKLYHAISTYGAEGNSTAKYAAPLFTTGWFVPSVGQCVKLVRELGGFTSFDGSKQTNSDVFTKIEDALSKVGGELDSNTANGKFWTSNTSDNKQIYLLELKKDENKCQIWTAGVGSKYRIRPILAF
ncbi:fimbrillin family protein [uncultured Bacteroides sp.]|uniref:fimbrillin family protein n=1 Tax=uncultured Bacteroides sp. TaxID=162156 RepID=UPI0025CF8A8A|nr:fimbrillin family protein [uncultured Bacteroides sp.]